MSDPHEVATTYFTAWREHDFDALRPILADSVTFRGPLGTADDADQCLAGLRAMSELMTDIDIKAMVHEGANVITWFELHTKDAPPVPTANWMQLEDGRIARIRVTFDPRPILG